MASEAALLLLGCSSPPRDIARPTLRRLRDTDGGCADSCPAPRAPAALCMAQG